MAVAQQHLKSQHMMESFDSYPMDKNYIVCTWTCMCVNLCFSTYILCIVYINNICVCVCVCMCMCWTEADYLIHDVGESLKDRTRVPSFLKETKYVHILANCFLMHLCRFVLYCVSDTYSYSTSSCWDFNNSFIFYYAWHCSLWTDLAYNKDITFAELHYNFTIVKLNCKLACKILYANG